MRSPAAVAALLLIGCVVPAPAAPWWTTLDSRALAELRPQDCTQDIPKPWQVEGDLRLVPDGTTVKPPDSPEPLEVRLSDSSQVPAVLEATKKTVRLLAGGPDWQRYAVTANVRLSPAGGSIALAAACTRAGKTVQPGCQVSITANKALPMQLTMGAADRDGPLSFPLHPSSAKVRRVKAVPLMLMPNIAAWTSLEHDRRTDEEKKAARSRAGRDFVGVAPALDRWFRLRVEVTPAEARFWVDGLLVGTLPAPRWTQGGVCLTLNYGDRVRHVRVEAIPAACDGYLPLDLTARCNRDRLVPDKDPASTAFVPESLPAGEQFIAVGGVPFHWTAAPQRPNCLDLSAAALRGGQEYIRTDAASGDVRRLLLRVPKRQYRALAILAAADPREKSLNVLNVRMLKPSARHGVGRLRGDPPLERDGARERGGPAGAGSAAGPARRRAAADRSAARQDAHSGPAVAGARAVGPRRVPGLSQQSGRMVPGAGPDQSAGDARLSRAGAAAQRRADPGGVAGGKSGRDVRDLRRAGARVRPAAAAGVHAALDEPHGVGPPGQRRGDHDRLLRQQENADVSL